MVVDGGPELFDYIVKKFEEKRTTLAESMGDGKASDYSHYRELVGERKGLAHAITIIEDLKKRYRDAD